MFKRINHILIAFLFCFCSGQVFSQYNEHHRSDNWLFGDSTGLEFNNGYVDPINYGESGMHVNEGSATISDTLGNLLFYTDGRKIWNRNHEIMMNGDSISDVSFQYSQTIFQSSIIIPDPANSNQYYVIVNEAHSFDSLVSYSIVDINGDNGLGRVVSKKNNLNSKTNERLAAVRHCNGKDFWFVVQSMIDLSYHVYLIDECGISGPKLFPSVSNNTTFWGSIKFSRFGNKIINSWSLASNLSQSTNDRLELGDFNPCTGEISNLINIPIFYDWYIHWSSLSFEFSNDEKNVILIRDRYIYPGTFDSISGNWIYKTAIQATSYDISNHNSTQIVSSANNLIDDTLIGTEIISFGSMQMANDGNIYIVDIDRNKLSMISNSLRSPEYFHDSITLNTGNNILCLPSFVADFISPEYFFINNICLGDSTTIKIANIDNADSILIEIPAIGLITNATFLKHKFLLSGEYEIILSVYDSIYINQYKKKFLIRDIDLIVDNEFVLCKDSSIVVTLDDCDYINVIWDSTNGNTLLIDSAGQYKVQVSDRFGCVFEDTINVEFKILNTEIATDISYPLCQSETLVLTASSDDNNVTFSWNDLSQYSNVNITESGVYSVTVKDSLNCLAFDTIQINFTNCEDYCSAFDRFINQNLFVGNSEFNSEELSEYFELMEFKIYDSKGSFIFKDEQFDLGTFNHLASGIYFVHFAYLCVFNGEIRTKSIKIAKIH